MNQFLEFAKEVLKQSSVPLIYQEIWEKGVELGLDENLKTKGKTPWQTVGAKLFVDVRDNENSLFVKIGKRPAKFYLKEKYDLLPKEIFRKIDQEEITPEKTQKSTYHERELHAVLSYFAYANTQFNKGKAVYTKTILHEGSKKTGLNEWVHPDIVGVYIPIGDWNDDILDFSRISNVNAITIYSFELKKYIDRNNYRESFFQAVSNSSWANEGFLVAAKIKDDDDLFSELERLSSSFGIGLIHLDIEDVDSSRVVFPAFKKKELDWDTMNKLYDLNSGFKQFIQDVKIDFDSKRIHKNEYDEILPDIEDYCEKLRKKES